MSAVTPLQNAVVKPQQSNPLVHGGLLLQRQCACGSPTSSLTGECEECKSKKGLQAKLTIGASNDPLEQEADRVADQVLLAPVNSAVSVAPPRIQRFFGKSSGQTDTAPASVERVLASSGKPLEPTLRQDMEQRFGHDFSRVRVHSSAAAEQSVLDVNARAYTVGHNLVFGAGRFAPETNEGRRLIAHELTHVVQQTGSDCTRISPLQNACGILTLQRDLKASPSPSSPQSLPQKIVPGSTPLSREVQAYRIDHPDLPEFTNLVAVEYTDPAVDQPQRRVFENRPGVAHSEEIMDQFFRDLRRSRRQEITVKKIYSERQFCGPSSHDCEGLLLRSERYRSAEKTFGYDFQEGASRKDGGGPYRRGQSRGQIEESSERLNETKNLEWDFQKRPTQPYYERKGGSGGSSGSGGITPSKSPATTAKPEALANPALRARAKVIVNELGESLRLMRTAQALNAIVRTVEFAGSLIMVYQSLSMAQNAQGGKGFILTDKIRDAEDLRDQAQTLNTEYPLFSDWVRSLGFSIYLAGSDPDSIQPLLGPISDLGSEISNQKTDLNKQSKRVKVALNEVATKRQAAQKILDDPKALAALDHGGGTLNAATVFAAEQDLSRLESALMQTDQTFDTVISLMDSDVEFLVAWLNWLEDIGIKSGKLKPQATIVVTMGELKELSKAK